MTILYNVPRNDFNGVDDVFKRFLVAYSLKTIKATTFKCKRHVFWVSNQKFVIEY